ncbi:MAG: DUF423 domain-containing protein [Saprospiraceae bacterium]|nr:DUF423 domain-containing protein [Saprospiraceae bacterium]
MAIAISGFIAVALGAFGAHGLRALLEERTLHAFETAVEYQFFHTFAMALCLMAGKLDGNPLLKRAYFAFGIGIILFSGSLYAIALLKAWHVEAPWLGPITPFGGLMFLAGWVYLGMACYKGDRAQISGL